jgi:two-component system NtrC family response regulator
MKWNVLVVDDEPEILRTLKNYLVFSGYNVMIADSGEAALEIVRNEKVHIVLCDIKMPGMDGLAVLEKIHDLDFSIQVIMITGYSTFDSTLKALEKGATDYILKPFNELDDVVKMVEISADRLRRWKRVLAGSSKAMAGRQPATGNTVDED